MLILHDLKTFSYVTICIQYLESTFFSDPILARQIFRGEEYILHQLI